MTAITAATVNKMLKAQGVNERLVKGDGYYYFHGGKASSWPATMVMVDRVSLLTLEEWQKEFDYLSTANQICGIIHLYQGAPNDNCSTND